jgi:regulator of sirC expression with transglutaminase-like and TPR domain
MAQHPREALLAIAAADGDAAEGALWLAAEDLPEVRPAEWLHRIDELAGELKARCGESDCAARDHPLMAAVLRERLRLRGSWGGDPRAHYLHHVIQRRAGVPIACAVIWIAIGRRANIPIEGVNLPGHFIVRVNGDLIDPIASGETLDDEDVRRLVAASTGNEPNRVDSSWLRSASTRDVLARMSRNLRGCYACLENWPLALQAADRCVDLLPDQPSERRDRGLLLWRMGRCGSALDDLRDYLEQAPSDAPDRAGVIEVMGRLRAFLN